MQDATSSNNSCIATLFESLQNPEKACAVMSQQAGEHFSWHGPKPFKSCSSVEEWYSTFWLPFLNAFSEVSRDTHMLFGGISHGKADNTTDGKAWVGATGYYEGVFSNSWLGFEPTHKVVKLRWGEFFHFEDNKLSRCTRLSTLLTFFSKLTEIHCPPAMVLILYILAQQVSAGFYLARANRLKLTNQ
jgi:hypothetical protein